MLDTHLRAYAIYLFLQQGVERQELRDYFLTNPSFWKRKKMRGFGSQRMIFEIDRKWIFRYETYFFPPYNVNYKICKVQLKFDCPALECLINDKVWCEFRYTTTEKDEYTQELVGKYTGLTPERNEEVFFQLFFDSYFDFCLEQYT